MKRLTGKQRFWLTAALLHLGLMSLGAAQKFSFPYLGRVGLWLEDYGAVSGASSGYGFFTPGVGSQLVARFEIVDKEGKRRSVPLETRRSHESDLRVGNIIGWFWTPGTDRKLQRSLAASWAGKLFGRHPEAEAVVVKLESYELVSMKEYREGKRPQWKPFYEGKFKMKPRKGNADESRRAS